MSPSTAAATGHRPDAPRPLTTGECRRWLQEHHEGRLGYLSGRGPRSVVVSYAVADDEILMRVPDYNDIAQYAPGTAGHPRRGRRGRNHPAGRAGDRGGQRDRDRRARR